MKRVFSIRLSYPTIAQCYDLIKEADPKGERYPVTTVISLVVEGMMRGLIGQQKVREYSDEEAEERLSGILGGKKEWPGIDLVIENPAQAIRELIAEECKSAADSPRELPVDFSKYRESREYISALSKIEEAFEQEIGTIKQQEEANLRNAVTVKEIDRISPEESPKPARSTPPWVGVPMISSEDLDAVGSTIWEAAKQIYVEQADEKMMFAVAIVFFQLPKKEWESDSALRLVQTTYKIFKDWGENGKT